MPDYVLIDGDQAIFIALFQAPPGAVAPVANVIVQPGKLVASGPATRGGKKVCIAGDEASVSVPGCVYTTPMHPIPGTGTLEIKELGADQTAQKTRSGDKATLLVGTTFQARFKVVGKAKMPQPPPAPPQDDATAEYSGTGTFVTTNTKFRGV